MRVIFYSNLVDKDLYNEIQKKSTIFPSQAIQKFNRLLTIGLGEFVDLYTISSLPIPGQLTSKLKIENYTTEKKYYTPYVANSYLRQFLSFLFSFFYTIKISRKNKVEVAIFDYMSFSVTLGGFLACLLLGIKKVVIVTDFPNHPGFSNETNWLKRKIHTYTYRFLNSFDGYILLTSYMNNIVNKKNKSSIIIEGLVDAGYNYSVVQKREKIILYAGGLFEKFGIKKLVQSFANVKDENYELHIYGNGDMVEYLNEVSRYSNNIKYFGEISNSKMVEILPKCMILINPRPSDLELTKYSFPSKIVEYMLSGTPVLTTKLPGIPNEYDDYLFYIENEDVEGFSKSINKLLAMSESLLLEKGKRAQNYVLEKKNNLSQGKKIATYLYNLSNK